jgi:hypothetical protein
MNPVDRESREVPPCGYGLLGLCCFDCLRGPCRISPFEKTQAVCGVESDLMVSGNLCRLTAKEFAPALKSFIRAAGEFRKSHETIVPFSTALTEKLGRKYGISSKELIPFLEKETTKLLDPLAGQPTLLFPSLFPERVPPPAYSERRCGPFLGELFGLLDWKDQWGAGPEALLWRCLDSAASLLIIEELTHDILSLLHPPLSEADQEMDGGIIPPNFPDFPHPVVVSLVEAEYPQSAEMQRMPTALKEISGVLFISLRGTEYLLRLCHGLQEKWHRRIFNLPMVALVESPRVSPILAPLALGLPAVSNPSLPIQGSKIVEDFFYTGLSKGMGNFYLPLKEATALSRLKGVLGRKL